MVTRAELFEKIRRDRRLFCDDDCANAYWWEWGDDA